MATSKKPTTKKSAAARTSTKARTTTKPRARKPIARTNTSHKLHTVKKSPASVKSDSLRLRRDQEDFMTFRLNRESLYWIILGAVVILFTLWILQLQNDVSKLYDQIESANATNDLTELRLMQAEKK